MLDIISESIVGDYRFSHVLRVTRFVSVPMSCASPGLCLCSRGLHNYDSSFGLCVRAYGFFFFSFSVFLFFVYLFILLFFGGGDGAL